MNTNSLRLTVTSIVLSIVTAGVAFAQRTITPFTPRIIDSTGAKVYIQPQAKKQSDIAITFGYGYSAVSSLDSYANSVFPFITEAGKMVDGGEITSNTGTFSIGINYEITPWLELNVPFVYSHSKGWQDWNAAADGSPAYDKSDGFKDHWFLILPSLKINWVRNNWLSVYTRAGVGIGMGNRWMNIDADQSSSAVLAYQISPVGIEMGKGMFNFFIEGGYGHTGMVTAGIKLKVGKVLKSGKTSTGRHVDWYDKYLQ